jgi:hypothetical protein
MQSDISASQNEALRNSFIDLSSIFFPAVKFVLLFAVTI